MINKVVFIKAKKVTVKLLFVVLFLLSNTTFAQTTVNLSPSADARIDEAAPTTNFGSDNYLPTHPWAPSYSRRSVIKFDLSSIPSGATIVSAKLKLMQIQTYGYDRTLDLHRLNTSWSESTVTWDSPWSSAGGDYNSTASASATSDWTGSFHVIEWNLQSDVQAFVNGTATNNGWLLRDSVEDVYQKYWHFASKEYVTTSARPVLEVVYNNSITVSVSPSSASICSGSSVSLTASGADSYSWSPSTGLNTTTGSVVTASPSTTTTYIVTGTTGSVSDTQSVTVTVNALPTVSVSPSSVTIVSGNSATLTASGANTYAWSPTNNLNTSTGAVVIASPTSTTTYLVTGTNANGCVDTQSVVVTVVNPTLEWADLTGFSWTSPVLTKTSSDADNNSSAFSKNHLNANQDGWVEFTLTANLKANMGFAIKNLNTTAYDVRYGFEVVNNTVYAMHKGFFPANTGYSAGDKVKVERVGTLIKYYKNGNLFYSNDVGTSAEELFIDANVYYQSQTLEVNTSFTADFNAYAAINDNNPAATQRDGSISLSPLNASGNVTYLWSTGATTSSISNLTSGTYTVTITDAANHTLNKSFTILNKPVWTKLNNMTNDGNARLTKTGTNDFDGWGLSKVCLPAHQNGYIEYTATLRNSNNMYFGISRYPLVFENNQAQNDICNAILFSGNATYYYAGGAYRAQIEAKGATTVFKIAREGNDLVYYIDGVERNRELVGDEDDFYLKFTQSYAYDNGYFRTSFGGSLYAYHEVIDNNPSQYNSGAISLEAYGGKAPYTYAWSNGATTASISNLAPGTYTVTITDADNQSIQKSIVVKNQLLWKNLNGMTLQSTGRLKKTATNSYNDGWGSSKNYLPAGQTGVIDVITVNPGNNAYIGFSTNPILFEADLAYNNISYGYVYASNVWYLYQGGAPAQFINPVGGGNNLKIAREINNQGNTEIVFYFNSTVVRRTPAPLNQDLYIAFSQYSNDKDLAHFRANFGSNQITADLVDNDPLQTPSGSISAEVFGGQAPYTYSWSSGQTSASISNLLPGNYTLTATDANSTTFQKTFVVANKVVWTKLNNMALQSNGRLTKTVANNQPDAWASSKNYIPAGQNGYMEYVATQNVPFTFGLSKNPFIYSFNNSRDISYGFYISGGQILFTEGGYDGYALSYYPMAGTFYKIARETTNNTTYIVYYINGEEKFRRTANLNEDLYIKFIQAFSKDNGLFRLYYQNNVNAHADIKYRDITVSANGAVDVTPLGGKPLHTYSWSNGALTEDISNLKKGNYLLTLSDSNNVTYNKTYEVLNEVTWEQNSGLTVQSDGLISAGSSTVYGRAKNFLEINQDGKIEFSVSGGGVTIGLTDKTTVNSANDLKYAMRRRNTSFDVRHNNQWDFNVNSFIPYGGDKFVIEKVGDTIKYKVNGVTQFTGTISTQEKLYVALYSESGAVVVGKCGASFGEGIQPLTVSYTKTDELTVKDGSINLSIDGGTEPYTVHWNDLSVLKVDELVHLKDSMNPDSFRVILSQIKNVVNRSNLKSGEYKVIVFDYDLNYVVKTIRINALITWANVVGVDLTNGITKTASNGWDNAYLSSSQVIDNGEFGIIINDASKDFAFGYNESSNPVNQGLASISYGFKVIAGSVSLIQSQQTQDNIATVVDGDYLSIQQNGIYMIYKKNNQVIGTSALAAAKVFKLQLTPYSNGFSLPLGGEPVNEVSSEQVQLVFIKQKESCSSNVNEGSISVTMLNDVGQYTYAWTGPNNYTSTNKTIANLQEGLYTVTVTNTLTGLTSDATYQIRYGTDWENIHFMNVSNTTISKKTVSPAGYAGMNSSNVLKNTESGWFEFKVVEQNNLFNYGDVSIGFTYENTDDTPGDIEYAIHLFQKRITSTSVMYKYEVVDHGVVKHTGYFFPGGPVGDDGSFKMEKDVVNQKINVYYSGFLVYSMNIVSNGVANDLVTDISAHTSLSSNPMILSDFISTFHCRTLPKDKFLADGSNDYYVMKRKLDGAFATTHSHKLKVRYDEKYVEGTLSFKVFDASRNYLFTVNDSRAYGVNLKELDFSSSGLTSGDFYILEVENDKGEKRLLRFRYY